tara:strand:+ start:271 stop:495 length:225 start_codon:yes stop_codon:yes gene_type:complete
MKMTATLESRKIEIGYHTKINEASKDLMTKLEIANYVLKVNGDYEAYALFLEEAAKISRRIAKLEENLDRFLET